MPKRRAASPGRSDLRGDHSPKRARTADISDSDGEPPTQTRPKRENVKGKGKARATNEDEGSDEENGQPNPPNQDINDEQFESENTDRLRAIIEGRRKVQGGVAEYGIIEYIEMHQFMCHKYLSFHFGPQINFIIGHNGSGKSAVLSAITVALGGKANSTGRGNGLKAFIREGQSVAEVTIKIKNQGEEAFKHADYGDSIVITRRFTKEGNSSWKIQNINGKVVSTKKDELAAICDHMNIQVDNPMNVLTQDSARQFLSASHPGDKYKFFLRGTQLSQLHDEYNICLENIGQTAKVLASKKEALPDLTARYTQAKDRYDEAAKAREQKKRADELKKELAWAHVAAKEDEMAKKIDEVAKMKRRLPKIEESLAGAEAAYTAQSDLIAQFEAELEGLGNVDHLHETKTSIQNEMRANKARLSDVSSDMKKMDASMKATNRQIAELDRQIAEESRRMEVHTQAKHEEVQRKLDEARNAVHTADEGLQEIITERKMHTLECDKAKHAGMEAEKRQNQLKEEITSCEKMIHQARSHSGNSLLPYGNDMQRVLERIKQMRWSGDEPLGPLGVYVNAKDPQTWGGLLRNQLGSFLQAFAVTDGRDRGQLKKLLAETRNTNMIIIFEKDMFDFRAGEPDPQFLTVLRALDISDPYVMRILINQAHIESHILSRSRKEAEQDLTKLRGGVAWSLDKFTVRVFPEGGVSSAPLNMKRQDSAIALLLTGRDTKSEINHHESEKARCEAEYLKAGAIAKGHRETFFRHKQLIEALNRKEQYASNVLREAKVKLSNLQQEANDDLPIGIAGFQAAKEEAEVEKESIKAQFAVVIAQKADIDGVAQKLLGRMGEIKAKLDDFGTRRDAVAEKVATAATERAQHQREKAHYKGKLEEEQGKVDKAQEIADVLETEFTNWTQKAEEYCARFERPRKVELVQRDLNSVQQALKEREKRHGASVEEMAAEVAKAKDQLDKAKKELRQMSDLNKALKASLFVRLSRWQEFRRHIALRCKLVFAYHLSQRGYYGKVLFNHEVQTLGLRVQTDDQIQTQGSAEKDPRSLSGGEKSFSTICLLLSLWESIGCPLRCLDEFDVFMDAVNRRISMKMMIETANASDKKQYILITPQDMTNVTLGPTVRVLRMNDPERGNGRLNFGSSSS